MKTSYMSSYDLVTCSQDFVPLAETPETVSVDLDGVPLLPGKRPGLEHFPQRLVETPQRLRGEDVEETGVKLT